MSNPNQAIEERLNESPPEGAVRRRDDDPSIKFLRTGYSKEAMRAIFGTKYSDDSMLLHWEANRVDRINKKTGEVTDAWDAVAVFKFQVTMRLEDGSLCVRTGTGGATSEGKRSRVVAILDAIKAAESDAFKRATYGLGKRLGLGLRIDACEEVEDDLGSVERAPVNVDPEPNERPSGCSTGERLERDLGASNSAGVDFGKLAEKERREREAAEDDAERKRLAENAVPYADLEGETGDEVALLEELATKPGKENLTRLVLREVDKLARKKLGKNTNRIWSLLGVELVKGAQIKAAIARRFLELSAGEIAAREGAEA